MCDVFKSTSLEKIYGYLRNIMYSYSDTMKRLFGALLEYSHITQRVIHLSRLRQLVLSYTNEQTFYTNCVI